MLDVSRLPTYANPHEIARRMVLGEMSTLGQRIRELRNGRGWSQQRLAEMVGVRQKAISSYERGVNVPSAEILVAVAEAFDVSLDYLAQRSNEDAPRVAIADRELLERVQGVDRLPDEERALVKQMMDLVLLKHRLGQLASGVAATTPAATVEVA